MHTHPAARADRPDTLIQVARDVAGESNGRITHRDAPVAGCRAPTLPPPQRRGRERSLMHIANAERAHG